jgi:hypothetical protein
MTEQLKTIAQGRAIAQGASQQVEDRDGRVSAVEMNS